MEFNISQEMQQYLNSQNRTPDDIKRFYNHYAPIFKCIEENIKKQKSIEIISESEECQDGKTEAQIVGIDALGNKKIDNILCNYFTIVTGSPLNVLAKQVAERFHQAFNNNSKFSIFIYPTLDHLEQIQNEMNDGKIIVAIVQEEKNHFEKYISLLEKLNLKLNIISNDECDAYTLKRNETATMNERLFEISNCSERYIMLSWSATSLATKLQRHVHYFKYPSGMNHVGLKDHVYQEIEYGATNGKGLQVTSCVEQWIIDTIILSCWIPEQTIAKTLCLVGDKHQIHNQSKQTIKNILESQKNKLQKQDDVEKEKLINDIKRRYDFLYSKRKELIDLRTKSSRWTGAFLEEIPMDSDIVLNYQKVLNSSVVEVDNEKNPYILNGRPKLVFLCLMIKAGRGRTFDNLVSMWLDPSKQIKDDALEQYVGRMNGFKRFQGIVYTSALEKIKGIIQTKQPKKSYQEDQIKTIRHLKENIIVDRNIIKHSNLVQNKENLLPLHVQEVQILIDDNQKYQKLWSQIKKFSDVYEQKDIKKMIGDLWSQDTKNKYIKKLLKILSNLEEPVYLDKEEGTYRTISDNDTITLLSNISGADKGKDKRYPKHLAIYFYKISELRDDKGIVCRDIFGLTFIDNRENQNSQDFIESEFLLKQVI